MKKILADTPENALVSLRTALAAKDKATIEALVDIPTFLNAAYDEATEEMAQRCAEFHELYPADLFFQYGPDTVRSYNDKFRRTHLTFFERFLAAVCDQKLKSPLRFEAAPINFCAFAFRMLHKAMRSTVKGTEFAAGLAVVTLELTGNIIYRRLIKHVLTFKFVFAQQANGDWQLKKVANVAALTGPIVDIAEIYWPKSWDLGISY